ncbi:MAG: hypothetical protein J3R72DRAFT_148833 [Linnemannia gamsii]|nr:MAG: hypothetical protein J3R72DRAFT_148833 [Linnemannia gamsii]
MRRDPRSTLDYRRRLCCETKSIGFRATPDTFFLMTGCEENLVYVWQLIREKTLHAIRRYRQSKSGRLAVLEPCPKHPWVELHLLEPACSMQLQLWELYLRVVIYRHFYFFLLLFVDVSVLLVPFIAHLDKTEILDAIYTQLAATGSSCIQPHVA